MHDDNQHALTYKRQTLIDVLKERLAEREQQREEARQKVLDQNKAAVESLTKALENPQFIVAVVSVLQQNWNLDPKTPEAFEARVEQLWPSPKAVGHEAGDPDAGINRLIRVYDKAVDEEVQVTVADEIYPYL